MPRRVSASAHRRHSRKTEQPASSCASWILSSVAVLRVSSLWLVADLAWSFLLVAFCRFFLAPIGPAVVVIGGFDLGGVFIEVQRSSEEDEEAAGI